MNRHKVLAIAASIVGGILPAVAAQPATLTTLYSFHGADGASPTSLVRAGSILYGTTIAGGRSGAGTVFKIDLLSGQETVLYSFAGGRDGSPNAGLTYVGGTLFGTTAVGGVSDSGTAFAIDTTTGRKIVLHAFGSGSDGASPNGRLLYRAGALYGTTLLGGTGDLGGLGPYGTVFEIDLRSRKESGLYSFGANSYSDAFPAGGLIAVDGTLFGTAPGDLGSGGEVFTIDPTTGAEAPFLLFTGLADPHSPYEPAAGLVMGAGMLYGTTSKASIAGPTIFAVDPATGVERTVHDFSFAFVLGNGPVVDFIDPLLYQGGALFADAEDSGSGSIIEISPATGQVTTLHAFSGGADGANPNGGLVDWGNAIFGTTAGGGASGQGTVFKLVP